MTDAEATLVMAAIMNNAKQLGVDSSKLTTIVSNAVAANPAMAVGLAYVAGALSSDANRQAITNAIKESAPDDAKQAIQDASVEGKKLEPAPETKTFESLFPLRTGIEGEGDEGDKGDTSSGSPLSTQEFIDINSES